MLDWKPSSHYRKVAEANRQYYAKTGRMYEMTETCVTNHVAQRALEADIDRIIDLIDKPPSSIRALDACGGSGNISVKLLKRGIDVTICDISSDLLDIFRAKCRDHHFDAKVICSEIGDFLITDQTSYDLIVFSSALHHLENIDDVLALAFARLRQGGLLFTVFDPTPLESRWAKGIMWLDYVVFKVHKQRRDTLSAALRRTRRTVAALKRGHRNTKHDLDIRDENLGVLAEYHVDHGIDDLSLVDRLEQIGFDIIWHKRYPGTRYAFTRYLLHFLRDVTSFKLLLRKPLPGNLSG